MYVQLPIWKCYLYSLAQRWRLYKAINSNRYRWGFNKAEVLLLRQMCSKYLEKGGKKEVRTIRYDQLIDEVLGHRMVVADENEIQLAHRLLIIKKINYRRLIMELKQIKEFGKEVGLKLAQMNKMEEDALVLEIIRNVEPKVQYSKELVAWYNELDDALFDQAEAESGATPDGEPSTGTDVSIKDVIEVIQSYSKVVELKEILADDDVAPLFEGFDPSPYKLPTQLKKAMIEHLEKPAEEPAAANGDDQSAEILELINEAEDEDGLVAIYGEYQSVFEDMEVPDDIDAEALQASMIAHVESKAQPEEVPDKPTSLKDRLKKKDKPEKKDKPKDDLSEKFDWWTPDADGFNVDEAFAKVEELKMTELRQFAKYIGLSIGIGKKKDEILDIVANKITEVTEGVSESTATGEVELTAQLIKDAVKAKDRDTLVEMCDQAEIKLNALQKKSIPGMEKKLLASIEDKTDDKPTITGKAKLTTKKEPATDAQSVYGIMESMVCEGKSEDAIVKKVSPIYKEKGKSIIFIKKRVQTMIQIIKLDNDLE